MNISLTINKIDTTLASIIHEDLKILTDIKKYVIQSGGKRIRPILHLVFCDLLETKSKDKWIVGSITELIHAASLLHDDVIDLAETRRGKKTVGTLYGNKTAILAGDFLLACGIERLNRLNNHLLMEIFTQVIRDLSVSELLQMQWEKNPKITLDIYDRIIHGKTASLFGAASESAAILAGMTRKEAKNIREFGVQMGNLFQKRDDLLDYFTESKKSGKDFLRDFQNKLYTYPVLVLMSQASSKDKKAIPKIIDSSDSSAILKLMEIYGIEDLIQEEIQEDINELLEFLTEFPESSSKTLIVEQIEKLR